MIPIFPDSKKVELKDKAEIDAHTLHYPPYSDFEFGSLWSWDVKQEMEISSLNDNLVVRFTDYTTGNPFLTFLGGSDPASTARGLLSTPPAGQESPGLYLVPEASVTGLNPDEFDIEESRDHFDYVCEVENHLEYRGNKLKSHRKLLNAFKAAYPEFERVSLDMNTEEGRREVRDVYRRWDENEGFITTSESFAYERFLDAVSVIGYTAVGIRVGGKLIAFHIASLPAGVTANALFSKADVAYRGAYAALDHVVAGDLLERGYTHMNIQQDLGIVNLRAAKLALHPAYLLKKYIVRLKSA